MFIRFPSRFPSRFPKLALLKGFLHPGFRRTALHGAVVLACLGWFSGESRIHHRGMSPYYAASSQFEDLVFSRMAEERRHSQFEQDKKVQRKILQVISGYETGLPDGRHEELSELIVKESRRYGHDPLFITALIVTESSFYNWARSHRGALGLMQLRPATALALSREVSMEWEGAPTLFNPRANIVLGAYYLKKLRGRFGDLKLALEAYNHGPSRLNKILKKGLQPSEYSEKVMGRYEMLLSRPI